MSAENSLNRGLGLALFAACGLACTLAFAQVAKNDGTTSLPSPPGVSAGATESKDGDDDAPKYKPWAELSKGYEQVISTTDAKSFYGLWTRKRDGAMLAELPRGWEGQKHFFAMTTPTGETFAGLQAGDMYCYWKKLDTRLVLIEPQLDTRSTGDSESKTAIKEVFTDRVVLDVPILGMGPNGQPVFDMKALLTEKAGEFYGGMARGTNARLSSLVKAKAFPENNEITYEMPGAGGKLQQFHYSISWMKDDPSYKPRVADERVGYFTTVYRDLGKFSDNDKWVRYVNRWKLEKRDAGLKKSEPKEPIVYYIEHTAPVRYRKFIRDGALMWNKAFEKVGIVGAIEVRQQDAETGAYMDIDPEDVRFNFIRWVANDIGTAIGPSRVNPTTGQIMDADVVLTDGWIRHFWYEYNELMPDLATDGFTPETMAWLDKHPQWDPRFRMQDPGKRDAYLAARMAKMAQINAMGPANVSEIKEAHMHGDLGYDASVARESLVSGMCRFSQGRSLDMAMMRLSLDAFSIDELEAWAPAEERSEKSAGKADEKKDDKKEEKKEPKYDMIDGVPDWFVGPALAELVAHEVGHTLGLRHNFKASSVYSWNQINGEECKGKKPWACSVMDYNPTNFAIKDGKAQGDLNIIDIGPYDYWAIEYGYTTGDTKEVLKRVAEPELAYGTDEDTIGPDPLARRYDMGANSLDYSQNLMDFAKYHRGRLLDKFVKDGQSWARARRGYEITLGMQTRALSMASSWVGGSFVNRDRKGDPNGRSPVQVVQAEQQRAALKWCIDNSFDEKAFGLTPELLTKMTVDKWMDQGGFREAMQEPAYPIHDRIAGIQSAVLTMLMNPTTLRRVYDNEFRIAADADAVTLPEVLEGVTNAVWSDIEKAPTQRFTARQPMISSLKRGLQQEHLTRLIDLTFPSAYLGEASKPVSNLAVAHLRKLQAKLATLVGEKGTNADLDPYTSAHLSEAKLRIDKALDAQYIYNQSGGGMGGFFFFGQTTPGMPAGMTGAMSPEGPKDR